MRRVLLLLLLICAAPAYLSAQQLVLPLHVGDRVMLSARLGDPMETANVLALRADAMSIAYVGNESTVIDRPFVTIDSIRVSQGSSRMTSAKWGAAFGAFVLGGAGAVTAPLAAKSMGWSIGQSMLAFGLSGALAGGSAGGVIGSFVPRERWKTYVIRRYDEVAAHTRP